MCALDRQGREWDDPYVDLCVGESQRPGGVFRQCVPAMPSVREAAIEYRGLRVIVLSNGSSRLRLTSRTVPYTLPHVGGHM